MKFIIKNLIFITFTIVPLMSMEDPRRSLALRESMVTQNRQQVSPIRKRIQCPWIGCNESTTQLRQHVIHAHFAEQCMICLKLLKSAAGFHVHLKSHHTDCPPALNEWLEKMLLIKRNALDYMYLHWDHIKESRKEELLTLGDPQSLLFQVLQKRLLQESQKSKEDPIHSTQVTINSSIPESLEEIGSIDNNDKIETPILTQELQFFELVFPNITNNSPVASGNSSELTTVSVESLLEEIIDNENDALEPNLFQELQVYDLGSMAVSGNSSEIIPVPLESLITNNESQVMHSIVCPWIDCHTTCTNFKEMIDHLKNKHIVVQCRYCKISYFYNKDFFCHLTNDHDHITMENLEKIASDMNSPYRIASQLYYYKSLIKNDHPILYWINNMLCNDQAVLDDKDNNQEKINLKECPWHDCSQRFVSFKDICKHLRERHILVRCPECPSCLKYHDHLAHLNEHEIAPDDIRARGQTLKSDQGLALQLSWSGRYLKNNNNNPIMHWANEILKEK